MLSPSLSYTHPFAISKPKSSKQSHIAEPLTLTIISNRSWSQIVSHTLSCIRHIYTGTALIIRKWMLKVPHPDTQAFANPLHRYTDTPHHPLSLSLFHAHNSLASLAVWAIDGRAGGTRLTVRGDGVGKSRVQLKIFFLFFFVFVFWLETSAVNYNNRHKKPMTTTSAWFTSALVYFTFILSCVPQTTLVISVSLYNMKFVLCGSHTHTLCQLHHCMVCMMAAGVQQQLCVLNTVKAIKLTYTHRTLYPKTYDSKCLFCCLTKHLMNKTVR